MQIHVPSQQPVGQLQKWHIIQTLIIKDNKHNTYETHTIHNKRQKTVIIKQYLRTVIIICEQPSIVKEGRVAQSV